MGFRLLGPVEVWAGSTQVVVGSPRQCAVLALLAADAGRPVPVEVLVDRLWEDEPPERARRILHTYIARLRRTVEQVGAAEGAPAAVLRRTGGYLLDVEPDRVDLHRFRRLVEQAREPAAGDERRLALLREALALWQGQPLAGVAGEWAGRMRRSWRQEQVAAVVGWAEAELRSGDPAVVPAPVRELAAEFPLVEPLAGVLMRAHAAAGRTAEALDVYAALRDRLAGELGADPGPELQAVHAAVLRGEAGRARPVPAAAAVPVVPAQLPADVPGFTGRAAEMAWLDGLLAGAGAEGQTADEGPGAVAVCAVSGTAGVGKTALAVHWAHRVAGRFPDGQLYVNLRGFDPAGQVLEPAAAVRGFLDALGVPARRVPSDPDAQAGLYRSLLVGKRVLVVVDNARDAEQVRPLLPGAATAVVVVTSRNQLTGLVADGAHPLSLDLLSASEARELLEHRLDPGRVAGDPDSVEQIIAACARLPLALTVAAARAATHPTFPLAALTAELSDAGRGQDAGDVVGQVRAVFSWSYTALTPPAARLFRLLGLHPGPDVSLPAAASLAGEPVAATRGLLAELARAGLVVEHAPGRYGFHDLLAAYAADLTQTVDSDADRRAATLRLLDHYVHTGYAANRLLDPARGPIRLPLAPPAAGAAPQRPTDDRAASAWLAAEQPVLLAALRLAASAGLDAHAWQLAWALHTHLDRRGAWPDLAAAWRAAVAAADRLGHPTATADAHRRLAWADIRLGRYADAQTQLGHALARYVAADDPVGQAQTQHALATMWERQGRPDRSLGHGEQALALCRAAGDRRGQAAALNAVGWYHALLGDHREALACCEQALALHEQNGDRDGAAATWHSLGYVHHQLADSARAADCYRHALALHADLGDRYSQAATLTGLGDTHLAAGDPAAAGAAWRRALRIFADLGHPDVDTVQTRLARLGNGAPTPCG